jgi:outer membrane protein assembly factor BamB
MHDFQRSGVTAEQLGTNLALAWAFPKRQAGAVPAAWADEAGKDSSISLSEQRPFKSRFVFDRANHVAVAGEFVFVGSAGEHTLNCLDAATGEVKWSFFTDGPVRLAPSVRAGKVFAGSDDGSVYCLEAGNGKLVWKYTPAGTKNYWVPNNGQAVSPWAVRSGVAVDEGTAYFAAGIFPHEGVYLCAVDAASGTRLGPHHWQREFLNQASFQGYLLLSPTRIYVPGARSNPWYFDRRTGALLGQYKDREAAGTFTLLSSNSLFFGRAGRTLGRIREADSRGANLAEYPGANAVVATAERVYLVSDEGLSALARDTRKPLWSRAARYPCALILAGSTLVAGGDDEVAAFDAQDGALRWKARVQGSALGLAVARGRLFVSTDAGQVQAFAARPQDAN